MSLHPSLRTSGGMTAHRNVFKRHERVKLLQEQGRWKPGDPVVGLAKVKSIKIKVKKEAKAPAEAQPGAPAAAGQPAATAAPAAAAKKAPEKEKKAGK